MPDVDFRILLVAIVAVALGVVAIIVIRHQRKLEALRQAAFAALGAKYGLRHRTWLQFPMDQLFPAFDCFHQGHSRRANHLFDGRVRTTDGHEVEVLAGEWHFEETTRNGNRTDTTTYEFGFVILGPQVGRLPGLRVRRENLLDRIAGAVGWDDIDFESVEFSKRFHVASVDKRFAYDLLDPRMIELFLVADAKSIPQVELAGEHLCVHHGVTGRLTPAGLDVLLQWGTLFVDRIPRMVRAGLAEGRYGARPR